MMKPRSKTTPRGRPARARKPSERRLVARCTDAEYAAAERCARLQGLSLADFIRECVDAYVQACLTKGDSK